MNAPQGWPGISARWTWPRRWAQVAYAGGATAIRAWLSAAARRAGDHGRRRACTPWLHTPPRNVHIVLEPMSHFRTHVVNTAQQLLALITLADHPATSWALFDTYHLITEAL